MPTRWFRKIWHSLPGGCSVLPSPGEEGLLAGLLGKPAIHIILLAAIGLLAYSNSFQVPFAFDDQSSITENPVIKDLANFISNSSGYAFNPRRFMGYLTIAVNYRLGGLDVTGYHAVNLGIHLITTFLLYYFCRLVLQAPYFQDTIPPASARALALVTGLLFVAHPVQTQAVTYIIQRLAALATLFYLLSLVMYLKGRLLLEKKRNVRHGLVIFFMVLSTVTAVAAMRTKETAFTLPLIAVLCELSFFQGPLRKRLCYLLPLLLTLPLIPLGLSQGTAPAGEMLADVSRTLNTTDTISQGAYLLTQVSVIVTYIRLLFLPMNQNLDYDYPINHTLLSPSVLLPGLLILMLLAAAIYLFRRSANHPEDIPTTNTSRGLPPYAYRLIAFGIFWFFLTLLVESSIIPIADVIFEHRLYLPSIGFCLILAAAKPQRLPARLYVLSVAAVVVALTAATWHRNLAWKSNVTLWGDVVSKSTGKARPHYNLGKALELEGRLNDAEREYLLALQRNPRHVKAHTNVGAIQLAKGQVNEAIEHFLAAIRLNPDFSEAHNDLGLVYLGKGEEEKAIGEFRIALNLNWNEAMTHNNLAAAYTDMGLLDQALEEIQIALRLNPADADLKDNLNRITVLKNKTLRGARP